MIHTVLMKYTAFWIYFNDYVLVYYVYAFLDTPRKRKDSGAKFFNHFRKDFIRPYGLAHDQSSFDPATLSRRLNNINCEFFMRPQIAISEFAETVPVNLKYIEENLKILDKDFIDAFIKKTKKTELYLSILDSNQKDKTGMCISFHNKLLLYWCVIYYIVYFIIFIYICLYIIHIIVVYIVDIIYIYLHIIIIYYVLLYIYIYIYIYIYKCSIYILETFETIKNGYPKCILCILFKMDKMVLIKLPIDTC